MANNASNNMEAIQILCKCVENEKKRKRIGQENIYSFHKKQEGITLHIFQITMRRNSRIKTWIYLKMK